MAVRASVGGAFVPFAKSLMIGAVAVALLAGVPAHAQGTSAASPAAGQCTPADLAKAVDKAGAALRRVNADATPQLQSKMLQLRDAKGWTNAEYEAAAMAEVEDRRLAELDLQASELLDRIDQMSKTRSNVAIDCAAVTDIDTIGIELVATIRAKTAHMIARLDSAIALAGTGTGKVPAAAAPAPVASAQPAPAVAVPPPARDLKPPVAPPAPPVATAAMTRPAPLPPLRSPQGGATKPSPNWSTTTSQSGTGMVPGPQTPAPAPAGMTPDVFIAPIEVEGYTIEEIRDATSGFFGQVSTGLAEVIEHAFSKSGKPTAYVLGSEGGGAILAGLRYGEGDLFLRKGGTRKVFWHGPSLGGDLGLSGSKTMVLIYKLDRPENLFSRFSGVDGSAYFVGGVGLTLLSNGRTIMAPIRSGVGLRLGANIGYIRFTETQTWNPF